MAKKLNYFLPYMRQGMAVLAGGDGAAGKRMTVPVKVNLQASDKQNKTLLKETSLEKEIALYGPGDILGFNTRVIGRLAPPRQTDNFAPALTPFVEFSEPDFLWRFSTRNAAGGSNRIPWLALVVLRQGGPAGEGEFVKLKNEDPELPPRIQLSHQARLPDLNESWRWAHVHVQELENASAEQVAHTVKTSPEKAVCRLLSPRKLKPLTGYEAFIVPAFLIGAEAALGLDSGAEDASLLTWETPAAGAGKIIPYYFSWAFQTGTEGDFEQLVRKLEPRELRNMGFRAIDCSNPGYGMASEGLTLEMEGALKSLDAGYQPWGMDATEPGGFPNQTQQALAELLNKREEKTDGETRLRVTPPVYGEWYVSNAGETVKVNPANKGQWIEELNLDFRHRAAAGLGVRFIRENQENLMRAAWEQLNKVNKVNRELNLGRLGRQLSLSMFRRLEKMKDESLLQTVMPLQFKLVDDRKTGGAAAVNDGKTGGTNLAAILKNSKVTDNLAQVKVKKYLPHRVVAAKKTGAAAFTPVETTQLVSPGFKPGGMIAKWVDTAGKAYEVSQENTDSKDLFSELGAYTKTTLHPANTIEKRLTRRVEGLRDCEKRYGETTKSSFGTAAKTSLDPLRPVMWYPEYHRPMYRFLRELSQDYILPGLERIPQNTVGLLQTNRRFIEAFMTGLNHEFASELRWREFPTDMRGSYFRSFWDTSIYSLDDQEKTRFRETAIGQNLLNAISAKFGNPFDTFEEIEAAYAKGAPSESEKEVADAYEAAVEKWLLTRDEDKDIDHPAAWKRASRLGDHPVPGKFNNEEEDQNQVVILIRGELLLKFRNTLIYLVERKKSDPAKPDLDQAATRIFPVFEGALEPDIVFIGFPITKAEADKYFLIFEERMTDLRFGLDVTAETDPAVLETMGEKDLSWQHFPTVAEEGYLDGHQPLILKTQWNSAAFIGRAMVQKQVRAAVELKRLVGGLPAPEDEPPSTGGGPKVTDFGSLLKDRGGRTPPAHRK